MPEKHSGTENFETETEKLWCFCLLSVLELACIADCSYHSYEIRKLLSLALGGFAALRPRHLVRVLGSRSSAGGC